MIHDPDLLHRLSDFSAETYSGPVYRATRKNLDPLAFSSRGGRWARPGATSVLYTSLEKNGALAEVCFHWSLLSPLPTKPVLVHELAISTERCLKLLKGELATLGISAESLAHFPYSATQDVGSAVAFLGHDGLIVPSARWDCENLILFQENHSLDSELKAVGSEEVEWQSWAKANGLL